MQNTAAVNNTAGGKVAVVESDRVVPENIRYLNLAGMDITGLLKVLSDMFETREEVKAELKVARKKNVDLQAALTEAQNGSAPRNLIDDDFAYIAQIQPTLNVDWDATLDEIATAARGRRLLDNDSVHGTKQNQVKTLHKKFRKIRKSLAIAVFEENLLSQIVKAFEEQEELNAKKKKELRAIKQKQFELQEQQRTLRAQTMLRGCDTLKLLNTPLRGGVQKPSSRGSA